MGIPAKQAAESMDVSQTLGSKLRMARLALGMSTRKVAEQLQSLHPISHATIANYERGASSPPLAILAALATIYERPLNWFLERAATLSNIRYRNCPSKLRVADQHRLEGDVQRWLEAYKAIETRLNCPLTRSIELEISPEERPEELALRVREAIGLDKYGADPLYSVVDVMHRFGIRVLEQPTSLKIDGLSARFGDEDVVVLNPSVPNDRCRMNAAIELGYVLLGDCLQPQSSAIRKQLEQNAHVFASHLLLPNRALKEAFDGQSVVRLVKAKEKFGISIAAMVYRAEKGRIIPKKTAKWLWEEFSKREWKRKEPGLVRPDRATRFEEILESAIANQRISMREAAALAGVRLEELHSRLNLAIGISSFDQDTPPIIPMTRF